VQHSCWNVLLQDIKREALVAINKVVVIESGALAKSFTFCAYGDVHNITAPTALAGSF